jgi:endonuclease I
MVSDLHHLFPTHEAVSPARGSDPFGEIPDRAVAPSYGINADGTFAKSSGVPGDDPNAYSEDRHEVFEPRGAHDGDAARAVFYFYTMYPGRAGAIERIVHADPRVLGDRHRRDPPDAWERQRNDRIEAAQGNRNPYIDDPDLVCRAWGIGCP